MGCSRFAHRYSGNPVWFLLHEVLRWFSSPGSLPVPSSGAGCRGITPGGLPHSEIRGSRPAGGSPRLIAVSHVLHRPQVPRHPPCALSSLKLPPRERDESYPVVKASVPRREVAPAAGLDVEPDPGFHTRAETPPTTVRGRGASWEAEGNHRDVWQDSLQVCHSRPAREASLRRTFRYGDLATPVPLAGGPSMAPPTNERGFRLGPRPGRGGLGVRDPVTIHRRFADRRLLAAPRSCSRVADCNPN